MKKEFNREIALENGLRESIQLDKGCTKRPATKIFKKRVSSRKVVDGSGRIEYITNGLQNFNYLGVRDILDPNSYREGPFDYFKGIPAKEGIADRLVKAKSKGYLKDIEDGKDFSKKTFYAYCEKQHKNTYTLRDFWAKELVVKDIDLSDFYDIAGRAVMISMSRKQGKVQVHQILDLIDEN